MSVENEVFYSASFVKDARKLPQDAQEKLGDLLDLLRENAFDPRLHTKALSKPLSGKFSFRITRDWRVGFRFVAPHMIHLLVVERRDQIYTRLKRL